MRKKGQKRIDKIPSWKEKLIETLRTTGLKTALLFKYKSCFPESGNLFILKVPGEGHGQVFVNKTLALVHYGKAQEWKEPRLAMVAPVPVVEL